MIVVEAFLPAWVHPRAHKAPRFLLMFCFQSSGQGASSLPRPRFIWGCWFLMSDNKQCDGCLLAFLHVFPGAVDLASLAPVGLSIHSHAGPCVLSSLWLALRALDSPKCPSTQRCVLPIEGLFTC